MITSMSLLLWLHALPLALSKIALPVPLGATSHYSDQTRSSSFYHSSQSIKHHDSNDEVGIPPVIWKIPVNTDAKTFMAAGEIFMN